MHTLPGSIGRHHHRFTHLVIWILAVTFSTNVMLAGVLSAQSVPAPSIAPAPPAPSVDLSAKALRGLMFSNAYRPSDLGHERIALPQTRSGVAAATSGPRVDSKSGGKGLMAGLLVFAALFAPVGAALLVSGSNPGEGCDTPDTTSCTTQKAAGATFLTTAAVAGVAAVLTKPGPSGVRAVTGTASSAMATTVVTNRTKHPLEVTMDGPTGKKVTISANSSQTVELEAGQYSLNVRAIGVDAEPYLAMQVYERGITYKEGFYLRK